MELKKVSRIIIIVLTIGLLCTGLVWTINKEMRSASKQYGTQHHYKDETGSWSRSANNKQLDAYNMCINFEETDKCAYKIFYTKEAYVESFSGRTIGDKFISLTIYCRGSIKC